jgi:hypothetical protein
VSDHNTLDDLVRVAHSRVLRCRTLGCGVPATFRDVWGYACDAHSAGHEDEVANADAIRRLVASGILR